jgi:hypothetical protein
MDITELSTAVRTLVDELNKIYEERLAKKREYEREYNKFMSLYNSLRRYLPADVQPPPPPDQIKTSSRL